ncbi:zinc finger protein 226-like [Argiope bruennichi]|uniref:zinc finger protein 226-like n=1 Tax=Argiope bruennichi TaxID=94029 RepID=UPI002493E4AD|nr:zinc finger protein 226-like [Argiope bruennichi]
MPYQIFGKSTFKQKKSTSFVVSSANAKSCYRPENDFPEAYNISPTVMESTSVDEEKQRVSGASDLIHGTSSEEDEMSRQDHKWLSLNKYKIDFMDSVWTDHSNNCNISEPRKLIVNPDFLPERNEFEEGKIQVSGYVTDEHTSLEMHSNLYKCVINKAISDCKNISGTANLIANPDLPSGSNEPKNGKRQVSEGETNEYISPEVHSQGHNKNKRMAVYLKEVNSTKEVDNAVAGPSGMSPHEKKFSCSLCSKEFNYKYNLYRHYLTHTGDKPFKCYVCNKQFSQKVNLDAHYKIHTGEKPYACDICEKKFNSKHNRDTHHRIHTGDRPFLQSGSGVSDPMLAMAGEEYKTSLEKGKWQTLNNNKKNFMDSLECVIRKSHSDNNNISGTSNSTKNLDPPSGIKEPRNGKIHASYGENDEHIPPEVLSQVKRRTRGSIRTRKWLPT